MTSRTENARKRKQTTEKPEAVSSSSDDGQSKSKARRVSSDTLTSTVAILQVDTPVVAENTTTANTATAAAPKQDVSIESIGALIQDMFDSDTAKVNAALDALNQDLDEDKEKWETVIVWGGCLALLQLIQKCVDKTIAGIPACDQVTELNELAELTTLYKTLGVIINLTFQHVESRVGITAIGGVEAVVEAMKTFPKCQDLQYRGCIVRTNLACCSIGEKKAVESDEMEVLLAAINNHLNSADVCECACKALYFIVLGSKERTGLLISLGGGAAVANVRAKWPDNAKVQIGVRKLAKLIATEMNSWADEKE
jgi:hypothetical protein